jgi:SAM-dependent methyltransferase
VSFTATSLKKPFLTINENGQVFTNEQIIQDAETLSQIFDQLFLDESFTLKTILAGQEYIVEAFDAPIVIKNITLSSGRKILGKTQWGTSLEINPSLLFTDAFDRFYGSFQGNLGDLFFILSPQAQENLFQLCDAFDDDSITLNGETFEVPPFYKSHSTVSDPDHWENIYQTEAKPGWDLGSPASILKDMLPRLRLPKSKILVLGSGLGHDAAFFASQGHVVTAVDFSSKAMETAKKNYPHFSIDWVKHDVFTLPDSFHGAFDIVFEHTCFCAIEPRRRSEMIRLWKSYLAPEGKIFAIFFSMFKREGPPYGSTEWEIRQHLLKNFQFIFWSRWRDSIGPRLGRELFVYAQKIAREDTLL